MITNANEIKFRCSGLGHLMTDPKSGTGIAEGVKTHLIEKYVSSVYGRQKDIFSKYITKGLQVEEDSITLYSRYEKEYFTKNEERLENEFITGCPDLFTGKSIKEAELIIDIKSSWDIFTFFKAANEKINKLYYWQLMGYMYLTGATKAKLAYCLVDTPQLMIQDEKRKLMWKMGAVTDSEPLYAEASEHLDWLLTYQDIDIKKRVKIFEIERNEADIQKIETRVQEARIWINGNLMK